MKRILILFVIKLCKIMKYSLYNSEFNGIYTEQAKTSTHILCAFAVKDNNQLKKIRPHGSMPSWLRYHSTKISWIKRFWEYYILRAYQVYTTLHFTNYCCVSLNYNVSSGTWYFLFFETVLNGALFSSYLEGGGTDAGLPSGSQTYFTLYLPSTGAQINITHPLSFSTSTNSSSMIINPAFSRTQLESKNMLNYVSYKHKIKAHRKWNLCMPINI